MKDVNDEKEEAVVKYDPLVTVGVNREYRSFSENMSLNDFKRLVMGDIDASLREAWQDRLDEQSYGHNEMFDELVTVEIDGESICLTKGTKPDEFKLRVLEKIDKNLKETRQARQNVRSIKVKLPLFP